ncbi:MAG: hypothetical protein HYT63_00460 [Candidatus Yanofskybacteria bacterium]|nr:hypothetical protein [Candidatus Yanofskybacteria bacterium]
MKVLKVADLKKFTPIQWLATFVVVAVSVIFLAGFLKMIFLPVAIGLVVWQVIRLLLDKKH